MFLLVYSSYYMNKLTDRTKNKNKKCHVINPNFNYLWLTSGNVCGMQMFTKRNIIFKETTRNWPQ